MLHIVFSPFPGLQSRLVVFCLSITFLLDGLLRMDLGYERQLVVSGEQHARLRLKNPMATGRNHCHCDYTLQRVTQSSPSLNPASPTSPKRVASTCHVTNTSP